MNATAEESKEIKAVVTLPEVQVTALDELKTITVVVEDSKTPQIIEIGVRGIQGAKGDSPNDVPFDIDPLEVYLRAKGE